MLFELIHPKTNNSKHALQQNRLHNWLINEQYLHSNNNQTLSINLTLNFGIGYCHEGKCVVGTEVNESAKSHLPKKRVNRLYLRLKNAFYLKKKYKLSSQKYKEKDECVKIIDSG